MLALDRDDALAVCDAHVDVSRLQLHDACRSDKDKHCYGTLTVLGFKVVLHCIALLGTD
jgi:hypothetical protein